MSPTCRLIVVVFALLALFVSTAHARLFSTSMGRWTKRDPIGYRDGMGLYQYCQSIALAKNDPMGLKCRSIGTYRLKLDLFAEEPLPWEPDSWK